MIYLYVTMSHSSIIRLKAEELRRQGFSLNEISHKLGISKSTASVWLKNIQISSQGRFRIQHNRIKGRENERNIKLQQTCFKDDSARTWAKLVHQQCKMSLPLSQVYCALLYWAEGGKTIPHRVEFTNFDPEMIRIFLTLLRMGFNIDESKLRVTLHLHEYHNDTIQRQFWHEITGIPLKQFHRIHRKNNSVKRRREGYQGCARICYYHAETARKIRALYLTFQEQFRGVG